jgi:hypothetical protein
MPQKEEYVNIDSRAASKEDYAMETVTYQDWTEETILVHRPPVLSRWSGTVRIGSTPFSRSKFARGALISRQSAVGNSITATRREAKSPPNQLPQPFHAAGFMTTVRDGTR